MTAENDETIAWVDGRIVPAKEARVSVLDHGFLFGDGVFEGERLRPQVRVYPYRWRLARRVARHQDRFGRCDLRPR